MILTSKITLPNSPGVPNFGDKGNLMAECLPIRQFCTFARMKTAHSTVIALVIALAFSSCTPEEKQQINAIGDYKSHVIKNNNETFVYLHPDSVFGFMVVKQFCPGTKIFCSAGKWKLKGDTVVLYQDNKMRWFKDVLPDLKDTITNVMAMGIEANYIYKDNKLYDPTMVDSLGKQEPDNYLDKVK
jgi:hypothetical protein